MTFPPVATFNISCFWLPSDHGPPTPRFKAYGCERYHQESPSAICCGWLFHRRSHVFQSDISNHRCIPQTLPRRCQRLQGRISFGFGVLIWVLSFDRPGLQHHWFGFMDVIVPSSRTTGVPTEPWCVRGKCCSFT